MIHNSPKSLALVIWTDKLHKLMVKQFIMNQNYSWNFKCCMFHLYSPLGQSLLYEFSLSPKPNVTQRWENMCSQPPVSLSLHQRSPLYSPIWSMTRDVRCNSHWRHSTQSSPTLWWSASTILAGSPPSLLLNPIWKEYSGTTHSITESYALQNS